MINQAYKSRALGLAEQQGELANSPAEKGSDGKPLLCAAACLAYVAIENVDGKECADKFAHTLVNKGDKNKVVNIFRRFGWGEKFCEMVMIDNDRTPRNSRINVFKNNLGSAI